MLDALADFRLGQAGAAQREGGVVVDREPGKARVLLEHDADPVRHRARDGSPFEGRPCPRSALASPAMTSSKRGLAAAGGPDDGKELALAQIRSSGPSAWTGVCPSPAG